MSFPPVADAQDPGEPDEQPGGSASDSPCSAAHAGAAPGRARREGLRPRRLRGRRRPRRLRRRARRLRHGGVPIRLAACASCGCAGCTCGSCGTAGYTYAVVGQGRGEFEPTTVYKFVGAGAGSVSLIPIPAPGCSCWWSLCFLWLLLLPLLLLPATTTTTSTTTCTTPPPVTTSRPPDLSPSPTPAPTPAPPTMPPQGPQRECWIFGDPHVTTFDGGHASFYSAGEYWIVRSDTVWMQGRYAPTAVTNGLSVMKEIAIGGPFLQSEDGTENVLRISALAASWNGAVILAGFPDTFTNQDPPVQAVTDSSGQILQSNRAGKPMHVVHVRLPLFITVQLNRWNEPGEGGHRWISTRESSCPCSPTKTAIAVILMAIRPMTPGPSSAVASGLLVLLLVSFCFARRRL
ncbi:unnamed protein product [Prorocentrum cordatum]|uniref:Uncharacterized protein n=1 Tax=Prorocentrum cordatum TaxID=2364126 RepID=A0ABN9PTR6_9DINO|nr:unnamed protein product [Polarella glacialis]